MQLDRRLIVGATLGLGLSTAAAVARERTAPVPPAGPLPTPGSKARAPELGVVPDSGRDETDRLQAAIDRAAERRVPLWLPAGRYLVRSLTLRPGSHLSGAAGASVLDQTGGSAAALTGAGLTNVTIEGLTVRGAPALGPQAKGVIALERVERLRIAQIRVEQSPVNGIALTACSGVVTGCRIAGAALAGLFSLDATGLEISHSIVTDCANNGILVWRSAKGDDGTIVAMNRIERIGARAGGSGQNGNAINVFRASGVIVTSNRIADCAYSAVRANTAADVQILANNVARMGEVALYAEFAFDGAVISANMIDGAATGISVTNFNEGGRLAAVQGNVVRNLVQRAEDRERSGVGIAVEADCAVTGNVIEKAPTAGMTIGWGRYCRDVVATGNVIRASSIGIAVTGDAKAGAVLLSANMITGATRGAIRAMDHGRPIGADLALQGDAAGRIKVSGNVVG